MAAKQDPPKKFGKPFYVCPECEGIFQCVTPEGERRIRLHQILHVEDGKERWRLLDEWRSDTTQLLGAIVGGVGLSLLAAI